MAVRGEVSREVLGRAERSAGYFEKLSDRREPELITTRCSQDAECRVKWVISLGPLLD